MEDNVEILNGFYAPPRTDSASGAWGLEAPVDGVSASFAGGLIDSSNAGNMSGTQGFMPELDLQPVRERRPGLNVAALGLLDAIDIMGGDQNAYIGRALERANAFDSIRSEEDPEGYQIDLNRAKVLSQKAYQETDPVKKAIYGREIKKLLPRETQGLDDLTAADMFTSNEKIELERLKQAGKLQLQQLKNSGNMDVAALKASSAEEINQAKLNTQWDIATLNNEYKKAIADGNNERAVTVQQMITDRQTDLAMLNNAAKLKQTEMQQRGQTERTVIQQEGQTTRTFAQNASREEIARINAAGALEREQAKQAGALERANIAAAKAATSGKGAEDQSMAVGFAENLNPDFLQKMYDLNESAGRWETNRYNPSDKEQGWLSRQYIGFTSDDYGIASSKNTPEAQDFQEFEAYARQIVSNQLKKILGGQFTQAEGDRIFASFGISPTMDPSVRWSAFINGMNNLAAKYGLDVRVDESGRVSGLKNKSVLGIGETMQSGKYKVTRRS